MSPMPRVQTVAARYDRSLRYAHGQKLPPEIPQPQPTSCWPPENVALLERYQDWRLQGGASQSTTEVIYVPMAGHALGLALKPHPQLDLDTDLQPALEYIRAKQLGPHWNKVCRNALANFRRFLWQARGLPEPGLQRVFDSAGHAAGLPAWLVCELHNYQLLRQANWRPARLEQRKAEYWGDARRMWGFFVNNCGVQELADLRRQHLFDYADHRLQQGRAASGINGDLRALTGFLRFLQEQGQPIPQVLLRPPSLAQPTRLPKFLTDDQVRTLRQDFETRVTQAQTLANRRDALLDRAVFYLLWQAGLRLGEIEEMHQEDLDMAPGAALSPSGAASPLLVGSPASPKLTVRQGKGLKDRSVYLSASILHSLQEYLAVRGPALTSHVFIYRHRPLCKDLVHARLRAAGKRTGINVHPHRLRHTCATQLLNAGCKVTSIQHILGHKRLNTTMIYARAHDATVANDYFAAMEVVEQRMELPEDQEKSDERIEKSEKEDLLRLIEQLALPDLTEGERQELASQIRIIL